MVLISVCYLMLYNYCAMVLLISDIAQYLILSASGTVNDLNSCTIAEVVQCMVSVKIKGNFYLICCHDY